jgi:hypothetical protein
MAVLDEDHADESAGQLDDDEHDGQRLQPWPPADAG